MLLRRTPARVEREKEVDGVVTPDNIEKLVSKHDKTIGADGEEEFGGQPGALAIIRCAEKYGGNWDAYTQRVPYVFVPGLV